MMVDLDGEMECARAPSAGSNIRPLEYEYLTSSSVQGQRIKILQFFFMYNLTYYLYIGARCGRSKIVTTSVSVAYVTQ